MAFIRKKNIKGKSYYYIVENKLINGKVSQKVLMYLGNIENVLRVFKDAKNNKD